MNIAIFAAVWLVAAGAFGGVGRQSALGKYPALTPKELQEILAHPPSGEEARKVAERVRETFGADSVRKGPEARVEGLTVAWALEIPGGARQSPTVVSEDGRFRVGLTRLGDTDTYATAVTLPDGAGMVWHYLVDGKSMGHGQLEVYTVPAGTHAEAGVPRGVVTQQPAWRSRIYADTIRDWWIYVPAQYKADTPACVMIFQDGGGYKNYVPEVFDNLIAKGEMPVTVGIFINPGAFTTSPAPAGRGERSIEYDTLSDKYSRFILEEILPEVEKTIKLRHDPESCAVAGISSGGICAFTLAWERPDRFGKVFSWVGSFTGIASGPTLKEGGNNYPVMIRKSEKKAIRVFLQDGQNDLDNEHGNWPLANQEMARALAYKGYDYKFVFGFGFHSDRHGRAILPDSLRWLWRGYKP